jgi:catechol 2,3-dioxygenase
VSDDEIVAHTEKLSKSQEGFEAYADWRKKMGARMNLFKPGL